MIIILCGHRDQTLSSRIFLSVPLKDMGNNRTRSQRELRWILIRPELATCEECFPIPGSYYMRMGDELGWVHALNAVGLRRAWVNGMRLLYTYTLWMRCFLWKRVEEGASKPGSTEKLCWLRPRQLRQSRICGVIRSIRLWKWSPNSFMTSHFSCLFLRRRVLAPLSSSIQDCQTVIQSFIVKSKAFYTAELPCFDWA